MTALSSSLIHGSVLGVLVVRRGVETAIGESGRAAHTIGRGAGLLFDFDLRLKPMSLLVEAEV